MTRRIVHRALTAGAWTLGVASVAAGLAVAGAPAAPAVPAPPATGERPAGRALPAAVDVPAARALPATTELPAICRQQANIICASKTDRTLRYFENGTEWLSAPARFGRPGYETPLGTWRIATKSPDQWWSYPYKVYMPWGMKFDTHDGLYVHYSSGFALNPDTYIGSHGCIQLGDWETAKRLYQRAPVGTTVLTY